MNTEHHDLPVLTPEQEQQLRNLPEHPDTKELPEAPADNWRFAQRGPFQPSMRQTIPIKFDEDVFAWLRRQNAEFAMTVNRILRERMEADLRGE